MRVRVRFAPSPTGHLHVGGARTALYNYLFARSQGGTFVLRIEDTDAARSTDESLATILDSLRWLGLEWDEGPDVGGRHGPYFQSQRREHYRRHAEALVAAGRAYACTCTAEELEQRRGAVAAGGDAAPQEDPCRGLDPEARAARIAEGRPAAIRFALPGPGETAWDDLVRGRVAFRNEVLDDFIVLRSDGLPTYNFACVVDDHEMEITHVVRGDDHISNTPRQILIYQALGWEPPGFGHVPMILGSDGTRLSKRHGATSVTAYRDQGYVAGALVNFLALLGWSYDGQRELFTLEELVQVFRLERVGSNPAIFNTEKLEWMNSQHLKRLPESQRARLVGEYLSARGYDLSERSPEWIEHFVRVIGDRLKTLPDAERYGAFVLGATFEFEPEAWADLRERSEVASRLEALAARLEADPDYTLESLERETRALATELGVKAGELIAMARIALTGRKVSPGIFEVMWLLGRQTTPARLRAAATRWSAATQHGRV